MGEIWLVRHGQIKSNTNLRYEREKARGWNDTPLDDYGKGEADILADYLWRYSEGVDKVWSSDLTRTMETAKPIANALQVPLVPTVSLRTWDIGELDGRPLKEMNFQLNYRVMAAPDLPFPNGESFNDFKKRVLTFFDERVKEAENIENDQILLSSSKTIKLIKAYIDGLMDRVSIGTFLTYQLSDTGELMRIFKASEGWVYQMIPMNPTTMDHEPPDSTN